MSHLTTWKPQGLLLHLLPRWDFGAPLNFSDERKVTKEAQLRVQRNPDIRESILLKSLYIRLFSHVRKATWWYRTTTVSLSSPSPLSFRDGIYFNSVTTFSLWITKTLQTHLTGTDAYRSRCFRTEQWDFSHLNTDWAGHRAASDKACGPHQLQQNLRVVAVQEVWFYSATFF